MLGTKIDGDLTTVGTYQLLGIELAGIVALVHGISAVLPSPEIRLLALKALEVGIDGHRVDLGLLVVGRLGVGELLVLHQFLELEPLHCHPLYSHVQVSIVERYLVEVVLLGKLQPVLAEGA